MSHITKIKTELRDQNVVIACLESMGFDVRQSTSYRTYYGERKAHGQTHEATHPESKYTVALTPDGVVFDSWGSNGGKLVNLLGEDLCNLKTKYAESMVYGYRNHLLFDGMPSEMVRTETDNEIRIEIRI